MSLLNLDKLLAPRRVAVAGAGSDPSGVGRIVLRNLLAGGFQGAVDLVHPRHDEVGGVPAFPSIAALPEAPDLVVVCTPAVTVPSVVRECGECGVDAAIVVSAGFREAGPDGLALERELDEVARGYPGLRILGPNCLGLLVPHLGLNASFSASMPGTGSVAFVSQSGALATAVIDWAASSGIGFSHIISLGNMLDVDLGDLIDYLGQDRHTRSMVLYIEAVTDARKFVSAARAFARSKPIVAYKSGRYPQSAQAAVSHTGAMAGEDAVYDAALQRAGIVRVDRIEEVFSTAELLARERRPPGPRLAIVTNAGGPGVMAADALIERGGELAQLSPGTSAKLAGELPASAALGNPIDVLGDAPPARFGAAVAAALADTAVDAVLVILTPQAMTDPTAAARAVADARGSSSKPVLTAWLGGDSVQAGRDLLAAAGIAAYDYPERAVIAFMHLVQYACNLETLYETPRAIPVSFSLDLNRVRQSMRSVLEGRDGALSEIESKTLLSAYEIDNTTPIPARDRDAAVAAAQRTGYPVVVKILSPDITHKTDVGGVAIGIAAAEGVRATFDRIVADARQRQPDARIDGVTVQPMASGPGYELIVGAKRDPTFGAILMLGAGGVTAELIGDRVLGLPPLNEALARRMLESLRIWPLLRGHRGRPAADLDQLIELLMRFSYLVADYPEITEIEMNPVLAATDAAIALDARAVVDKKLVERPPPRFSHLAIRPYPQEYTTERVGPDGLLIRLRPIRPEDEPLWHEMLAACSRESIHRRFRGFVKHESHEIGSRFCFIDYDRELAIVAEITEGNERRLAGVGRLVADADHRNAEYALLVADPWQRRGLADLLTDYCLEVAGRWGVEAVFAETEHDNRRMIAVMERHGFNLENVPTEGLVIGRRGVQTAGAGVPDQ